MRAGTSVSCVWCCVVLYAIRALYGGVWFTVLSVVPLFLSYSARCARVAKRTMSACCCLFLVHISWCRICHLNSITSTHISAHSAAQRTIISLGKIHSSIPNLHCTRMRKCDIVAHTPGHRAEETKSRRHETHNIISWINWMSLSVWWCECGYVVILQLLRSGCVTDVDAAAEHCSTASRCIRQE